MKLCNVCKFFVTNSSSDVYAVDVERINLRTLIQAQRVILALAHDKVLLNKAINAAFNMFLLDYDVLDVASFLISKEDFNLLFKAIKTKQFSKCRVYTQEVQRELLKTGLIFQVNYPQSGDGYLTLESLFYNLIVESLVQYFKIPTIYLVDYSGLRFSQLPLDEMGTVITLALDQYKNHKLFVFVYEEDCYGELVLPRSKKESLLEIVNDRSELKQYFESFLQLTEKLLQDNYSSTSLYADENNLAWILNDVGSAYKVRLEVHTDELKDLAKLIKLYTV